MDAGTRTARLPDQNRFWVALGLGYKLTDSVSLDGGYSHAFIRHDTPVDETTPGATGTPDPTGGHLVGSYDAAIDVFSVAAKLKF